MPALPPLMSQLETIWTDLDRLFGSFDDATWDRQHGPDWIFSDVPFHLAYYDNEMIAEPIRAGESVDASDEQVFRTLGALDRWNEEHFAGRSANHQLSDSLMQMRAARDRIRSAVVGVGAAGSDEPVFVPLPSLGWVDAPTLLVLAQVHSWNHFTEANLRTEGIRPSHDPVVTRNALAANIGAMAMAFDAAAAPAAHATNIVVEGRGGGSWTIAVDDGRAGVTPEVSGEPDLLIRYRDADAFASVIFRVEDLETLMGDDRLSVSDLEGLEQFGRLFPPPNPDAPFPTQSP